MTLILSDTFAPPMMATNGRAGLASVPPRYFNSFSIKNPATALPPRFLMISAAACVDACAR